MRVRDELQQPWHAGERGNRSCSGRPGNARITAKDPELLCQALPICNLP
jgi:hypothetical protein